MNEPRVLVSLVTFNDEAYLEHCVDSLRRQTTVPRIKVLDNASRDGSLSLARTLPVHSVASPTNIGYSAGHNQNLHAEEFDFALLLNADVVLEPDYLERLIEQMDLHSRAGLAGGKLRRMDRTGQPVQSNGLSVLDSTGVYFTPSQRHFDRGSGELDQGQYEQTQWVFGITGAALLCRRTMIQALIEQTGEFLDEDFFAYREDAELAWRAQILGWRALYIPRAVGLHCRQVLPSRRRSLEQSVNLHSVKNRFLMRMKNMGRQVGWRCFPYMWLRDLGIILYLLIRERTSLPALRRVWQLRTAFRAKKRLVEANRKVGDQEIAGWFSFTPQARDV